MRSVICHWSFVTCGYRGDADNRKGVRCGFISDQGQVTSDK